MKKYSPGLPKKYEFGLHPLIKLGILVILNIIIFNPTFSQYNWIVILVEIGLTWLVQLHFEEIKGFFKILLLNFATFYLLFYFVDFSWISALFIFIEYAYKMIAMFLGAFLFTKTTPPKELIIGLHMLGVPHKMAFAITIAISFLPMITKKIQQILALQEARGYRLSIFCLGPIIFPAVLSLMEFSVNLSLSLRSRGFELE